MQSISFLQLDKDHCLYSKDAPYESPIFLIFYIGDILLSGRHIGKLAELQRVQFTMKDIGPAHHILGMKITQNQNRDNCVSIQLHLTNFGVIQHASGLISFNTPTCQLAAVTEGLSDIRFGRGS